METVQQTVRQWFSRSVCLNELTVIAFFSLCFVLFENIAFWQKTIHLVEWINWREFLLLPSFFIFVFCGVMGLFSLLLWRPLLKPVLVVLFLVSAGVNYFCMTYSVYIDRGMIQNVMRTDSHETLALLTPQFVIWVIVFGVLPAMVVVKVRVKQFSLMRSAFYRTMVLLACIVLMLVVSIPLYKEYASFFRNNREVVKLINPTNYLHAVISYGRQHFESMKPLVEIGTDAQLVLPEESQKPTLFIMVMGEASRAQNFSLLGYGRETNPLLSQQKGVLAFQNVTSCGTATAVSVPCMFSNMPRSEYSVSRAGHQENVLDILQRAGVNVLWKENNTGCQGQCERIPNIWVRSEQLQGCQEDYCYDEQLLDHLGSYVDEHQGQNMMVVLHTIGSHGPSYYRRYARGRIAPFEPACETNQIHQCSEEALVNVYDNTILYVDYVLNETIEFLKKYESDYEVAMLYVSDHGQSLGERGIYLHGAPYVIAPKEQTQIPMIFWASDEFARARKMNSECLRNNAQGTAYSHDNVFHSLLGLMRVATSEYQQELDIFRACESDSHIL